MHVRRERMRLDGGRERTYVSLAHNVWGMGKKGSKKQSRPVVFARLGAEENLDIEVVQGMRSALDKLILQLMARDAAKADTPAAPTKEGPEVVQALASKVRAHEGGLRMLTSRQFGMRHVVEAVWKRLGFHEVAEGFAAQHRISFAFERVLFAMVLNRLVDPSSKRACNEWVQDVVWFPEADGWDVHLFYRALDVLEQHAEEMAKFVTDSSRRRLPTADLQLLLMDTTSTFFATDLDDVERAWVAADWDEYEAGRRPKPPSEPRPQVLNDPAVRMRGHSKDHRPSKPQVVLGLVAGRGGRVLRHKVYEGNRQDQKIAADLLAEARTLAPKGRVAIVTDSGMGGEPNLARIDAIQPRVDRITAVPLRTLKKAEEVLSRPGRWQKHPTKPHLTIRAVRLEDSSPSERPEVFIATRNEKTAAQQLRTLERNIERVRELLAKDDGIDEHGVATCKMLAKPSQKRLVRATTDGRRMVLDQAAIQRERRLAGVHVLRTTLTDMKRADVVDAYQGLLAVEDDFRQFKGPLRLRPMHHRRADRIRAHILVCVLALVVKQEIERLTGMSLTEIDHLMKSVTVARMADGGRDFWMRAEWPAEALPLLEQIGARRGPRTWGVGSGSTAPDTEGTS
jgi:Transposase DDE domain